MDAKDFDDGFPGKLLPIEYGCFGFVPDDLPPKIEIDPALNKANEQALLLLGELRAILPTLPNPKLVSEPFLRREAVQSSQLEGTHTELGGLILFETIHSEFPTAAEADPDAATVERYVKAMNHGLEQLSSEKLPICNRVLKSMHAVLMEGTKSEDGRTARPGEFRYPREYAFVGGNALSEARYVAAPPESVEEAMHKLERFLNSASSLPGLIRIALAHYQFEAIHPFCDGNGRVGRLLITMLLCQEDMLPGPLLYISAHFNRNKSAYAQRLWRVSCRSEWREWILYFLEGVKLEAQDATRRAHALLDLRERYRAALAANSASSNLFMLLDRISEWPATSANRAMAVLECTYNAANASVSKLEELGIVTEKTGQKRNRVFVADEIVALMS
jgi:Fic family protein